MRYVITRYEEYQKEMAYRIYITDRLYKSSDRMYIPARQRYYELVYKSKSQIQDKRSGDEIAGDVIAKAGLVVKK